MKTCARRCRTCTPPKRCKAVYHAGKQRVAAACGPPLPIFWHVEAQSRLIARQASSRAMHSYADRAASLQLLRQIVDFDHPDTGAAAFSGDDRGVRTRQKAGRDGRFQRIRRGEASGADLRCLVRVILPVIVPDDERSVVVPEL